MRSDIVLTLTGPDRVGIVEEVTRVLLELGGNVDTSRMARLGGEFAILMQVSVPEDRIAGLDEAFSALTGQGYSITTKSTDPTAATYPDWLPYRVTVAGADHEGIVHEIAAVLSSRGITIESAETGTSSAPVSGTPLFHMSALVLVPPALPEADWMAAVAEAGERSGVDVTVTAADPA